MRWIAQPLLLLSLISIAVASEHAFFNAGLNDDSLPGKSCCLPKQWEGRVGMFFMKKKLLIPKIRMADSKVGVDYKNQKVGARSMMYCPYTKKIYTAKTLVDFKAKKAYAEFGGKCKIYDVKAKLNDTCIPSQFKSLSPYFYGAGSSRLGVSPFGFRDNNLEYFLAVATSNCVPIKGAFRTRRYRRTVSIGKYQYYNITTGNSDKDLYQIPPNCTKIDDGDKWSFSRRLLRYTTEQEHPLPVDSELLPVLDESSSVLHSVLNSHAAMVQNARIRNCRWCKRMRHSMRRGLRQLRNRWQSYRGGYDN